MGSRDIVSIRYSDRHQMLEICSRPVLRICGEAGETAKDFRQTGETDRQILYLADFIEETRDFDGVEPARQLAFENLDRAMIYCLEFSLRDLLERHLPIHPDTVDALNELYLKKKDS